MPRDQLLGLAADADRLLAAGAAALPGHEGLARRTQALRDRARQVPALAPVADVAEKAVTATPAAAATALLDLVAAGRQLRASLSAPGLAGDFVPAPPSGPWRTALPTRNVLELHDALTSSADRRLNVVKTAAQQNAVADLRLTSALLAAVRDDAIAETVAEQALPAQGRAILAELRAALNLRGGAADAHRLTAIARTDPAAGAALCRQALTDGSPTVRSQALACLADVGRPGEVEAIVRAAAAETAHAARRAALDALAARDTDAAIDGLIAAALEDEPAVRAHARLLLEKSDRLGLTGRLLRALAGQLASLDAARRRPRAADVPRLRNGVLSLLTVLRNRPAGNPAASAAALLPLARHPDAEVAGQAIRALGRAAAAPGVVDALARIAAEQPGFCAAAFAALADVPVDGRRPAFSFLVRAAVQPQHPCRAAALRLVVPYLPTDADLVRPAILAALNEPPASEVFAATATALGDLGPSAREFLPTLRAALARYNGKESPGWSAALARIDRQATA